MLQIIGFILCAILYAIGDHALVTVNRSDEKALRSARRLFAACIIAAIGFAFALLEQGNALNNVVQPLTAPTP